MIGFFLHVLDFLLFICLTVFVLYCVHSTVFCCVSSVTISAVRKLLLVAL